MALICTRHRYLSTRDVLRSAERPRTGGAVAIKILEQRPTFVSSPSPPSSTSSAQASFIRSFICLRYFTSLIFTSSLHTISPAQPSPANMSTKSVTTISTRARSPKKFYATLVLRALQVLLSLTIAGVFVRLLATSWSATPKPELILLLAFVRPLPPFPPTFAPHPPLTSR